MRMSRRKPAEKPCTACNGSGHLAMVADSKKPTVRIYPPQCGVCLGKGRVWRHPAEATSEQIAARQNADGKARGR
jgi:DnaJ-class molecular chaperone